MALMLENTYDAFIAAGAGEVKARAAASEIAAYESRIARIETRLELLTWMVGFTLAGVATLLFKSFHS